MAGQIKVDSINADSNLALKIANTAVAFIDSSGLRPVGGNVNLDATATSKFYLPSANTVAIQTAGVTGLSVSSSQVVTLANALPVGSGGTGNTATPTAGGIVYGTGTVQAITAAGSSGGVLYSAGASAPAFSAAGTSGQYLKSNGASAPTWVTLSTGPGTHQVLLRTGNGVGSSGNKIRRFTTTVINTGTAITYADSSSDGASFTINEDGIYAIVYADTTNSAGGFFGVTVNQPTLTTAIYSVPAANAIGWTSIISTGSSTYQSFATVYRFAATDVVRPCIGNTMDGTDSSIRFYITKIAS
jgi:hypothetical protein